MHNCQCAGNLFQWVAVRQVSHDTVTQRGSWSQAILNVWRTL